MHYYPCIFVFAHFAVYFFGLSVVTAYNILMMIAYKQKDYVLYFVTNRLRSKLFAKCSEVEDLSHDAMAHLALL